MVGGTCAGGGAEVEGRMLRTALPLLDLLSVLDFGSFRTLWPEGPRAQVPSREPPNEARSSSQARRSSSSLAKRTSASNSSSTSLSSCPIKSSHSSPLSSSRRLPRSRLIPWRRCGHVFGRRHVNSHSSSSSNHTIPRSSVKAYPCATSSFPSIANPVCAVPCPACT